MMNQGMKGFGFSALRTLEFGCYVFGFFDEAVPAFANGFLAILRVFFSRIGSVGCLLVMMEVVSHAGFRVHS
jgi:hypothetical protein